MVKELEADRDLLKTVTLLNTVNQATTAQKIVKSTTIKGCWLRSTCIKKLNSDNDYDFDIDDEYL